MRKLSCFLIILAGMLWGSMGIFVRGLNAEGLDSMQVVGLRTISTGIMILIITLVYDRSLLRIRLKDCWCFIGTGVCSIIFFNYCYFKTIALASLSVAAILLYTAPSMVMLMSLVLFKEKMSVKKGIALLCAFLGCVCVTGVVGKSMPLSIGGVLVGLGAGFGYALYSIFGRFALQKGYSSLTITAYTFLFAGIGSIPLTNVAGIYRVVFLSPANFIFCIIFVVVSTILPYFIYTLGLNNVEAGKASIMASVEPVVATIIGALVFEEKLDTINVIGIALVLLSLVVLNIDTSSFMKRKCLYEKID